MKRNLARRLEQLEQTRSKGTVVYRMLDPGAVVPDAQPGRRIIRLTWGDDRLTWGDDDDEQS